MLALLGAAHGDRGPGAGSGPGSGEQPLLVFDEIDAGIGGHTARAVGEQLRALASGRQILCITHLPQVASMAQSHFRSSSTPRAARRAPRSSSCEAIRSSVSSCGCSAPTRATAPPAGTRESC